MTANSAGAGSRKRLTGRRELLSSREVLYPLLCRRKRADRNAAYLGDGSRLKLVAFSAPGSIMARCASRRWGGRLLSPADRCSASQWLISSGATTVVPHPASFTVSDQVQFVASDAAGILRPVRINVDLRKRPLADRDAFPCRRI